MHHFTNPIKDEVQVVVAEVLLKIHIWPDDDLDPEKFLIKWKIRVGQVS